MAHLLLDRHLQRVVVRVHHIPPVAQIAIIVAGYDRIRKGKNVVQPDASLSHAANFLLMLNGERPTPTAEKALDVALIQYLERRAAV